MSRHDLKGIFSGLLGDSLSGLGQLGGGGLFGAQQAQGQFGRSLNDLAQMQGLQQSATEHQMRMQREALEMELMKQRALQQQEPPPRHPYEVIERDAYRDVAVVRGPDGLIQKVTGRQMVEGSFYATFREELQAEVDAWLAPVAI